MRPPRRRRNEMLQEQGRRDRPRIGRVAGAREVGDLGLEHRPVGRVQRQPPHRVLVVQAGPRPVGGDRSEEHTSELQSLMRISYAVFCLKKKKPNTLTHNTSDKNKNTENMM